MLLSALLFRGPVPDQCFLHTSCSLGLQPPLGEVAEVTAATAFSIGQDKVFDYAEIISAALCYSTCVLQFVNLRLGHFQSSMASKSISPFLSTSES